MQKEAKLRTGRLISHCAMMSVPTYARRFIISDVALNIAPDTDQKRDICQNAIGFARALGIDAAEGGGAGGGGNGAHQNAGHARRRDPGEDGGPSARSSAASSTGRSTSMPRWTPKPPRIKHISSPVAGLADVLIVPNIEAGNMVYKNLAFMADAQTAGLVVGARVPVILTSRADTRRRAPLLGRCRRALRRRAGARSRQHPARTRGVTAMTNAIIVINAGSTSLKFGAYAMDAAGVAAPALPRPDRRHAGRPAFRREEPGRQAMGRA